MTTNFRLGAWAAGPISGTHAGSIRREKSRSTGHFLGLVLAEIGVALIDDLGFGWRQNDADRRADTADAAIGQFAPYPIATLDVTAFVQGQ